MRQMKLCSARAVRGGLRWFCAGPTGEWRLVAPERFQYELPDARIADRPASPRGSSRLLVCVPPAVEVPSAAPASALASAHNQRRLMRGLTAQLDGAAEVSGMRLLDRHFGDVEELLGAGEGHAGPLLVLNKTRVIRARMRGTLVRQAAIDADGGADGAGALVAAAEALVASGSEGGWREGAGAPRVGRATELLFLQPLEEVCADADAGAPGSGGSVSAPAALCAGSGAAVWRCLLRGKKVRVGDVFLASARLCAADVAAASGGMCAAGEGTLTLAGRVLSREGKEAVLRFSFAFRVDEPCGNDGSFEQLQLQHAIELLGEVPLPPYMRRAAEDADAEAYQTVYAGAMSELGGSVAAPTAGLHFSEDLLERLARRDVPTAALSLQVGWGTFAPLDDTANTDITQHSMHVEPVSVDVDVLEQVAAAAATGGESARPIVAVGTTSLRTLESLYWWGARLLHEEGRQDSCAWASARLAVGQWDPLLFPAAAPHRALEAVLRWAGSMGLVNVGGDTQLLLTPSVHRAGARTAPGLALCDALLTNFHQPRSTLLLLVAKLLSGAADPADEHPGAAQLLGVYEHALQREYRFLSYGDACLFITPDASKIRTSENAE